VVGVGYTEDVCELSSVFGSESYFLFVRYYLLVSRVRERPDPHALHYHFHVSLYVHVLSCALACVYLRLRPLTRGLAGVVLL